MRPTGRSVPTVTPLLPGYAVTSFVYPFGTLFRRSSRRSELADRNSARGGGRRSLRTAAPSVPRLSPCRWPTFTRPATPTISTRLDASGSEEDGDPGRVELWVAGVQLPPHVLCTPVTPIHSCQCPGPVPRAGPQPRSGLSIRNQCQTAAVGVVRGERLDDLLFALHPDQLAGLQVESLERGSLWLPCWRSSKMTSVAHRK